MLLNSFAIRVGIKSTLAINRVGTNVPSTETLKAFITSESLNRLTYESGSHLTTDD